MFKSPREIDTFLLWRYINELANYKKDYEIDKYKILKLFY
jgi:hypothetical protein